MRPRIFGDNNFKHEGGYCNEKGFRMRVRTAGVPDCGRYMIGAVQYAKEPSVSHRLANSAATKGEA